MKKIPLSIGTAAGGVAVVGLVISLLVALILALNGKGNSNSNAHVETNEGDNHGIVDSSGNSGDNDNSGSNTSRTGANLDVVSITLNPASPQVGVPFRLEVVIENVGTTRTGPYTVNISIRDIDRRTQVPFAILHREGLDPGERYTFVSSDRCVRSDGNFQVQVEIIPSGKDTHTVNNIWLQYFITSEGYPQAYTCTPIPTQTPTLTPTVLPDDTPVATSQPDTGASTSGTAIANVPFVVIDKSGESLGSGIFRLYVPESVRVGNTALIRLEIDVNSELAAALSTPSMLSLPPSPTTAPGSAPPTLPPATGVDPIFEIRQYMGVDIRGTDYDSFTTTVMHPDPIRNMSKEVTNWWEWHLTPKGKESAGTRYLQIYIYFPRVRDDGVRMDQEIKLIDFQLRVKGESKSILEKIYDFFDSFSTESGITSLVVLIVIIILEGRRARRRE